MMMLRMKQRTKQERMDGNPEAEHWAENGFGN